MEQQIVSRKIKVDFEKMSEKGCYYTLGCTEAQRRVLKFTGDGGTSYFCVLFWKILTLIFEDLKLQVNF